MASRGSQRGILDALERLHGQGLVSRAEVGPSAQYALNRAHLAMPAIEALMGMRTMLWDRLRDAVEEWEPRPVHLSVFGSAARGDGGTAADVDLFVVRQDDVDSEHPAWREQVSQLGDRVLGWTGNHAGIAELAISDVPDLAARRPELASNLRDDAIVLVGPPISELLESR